MKKTYWFFNTNETNGPGAYEQMFARHVAAIWGYPDGSRKLEGAKSGDCILAYVNGQGLRAVGRVLTGNVEAGSGVFLDPQGDQRPAEYHLKVNWEVVLPRVDALSFAAAQSLGCPLPVRCSFARLKDSEKAETLVQAMRKAFL